MLGPGPGSYQPLQSMGKQVLSTKTQSAVVGFGKAERGSLVPPGISEIGPAEYKPAPAACEIQVDSRKPTCATIKFGDGYRSGGNDRDKHDLSEPAPGYDEFPFFFRSLSHFHFHCYFLDLVHTDYLEELERKLVDHLSATPQLPFLVDEINLEALGKTLSSLSVLHQTISFNSNAHLHFIRNSFSFIISFNKFLFQSCLK